MTRPSLFPVVLLFAACATSSPPAIATRPFNISASGAQAPFASDKTSLWTNYTRVAPNIATAGRSGPGALEAVTAAGFKTVVDLRSVSEEGVEDDAAAAARLGVTRLSMPMPSDEAVVPAFVSRLSDVLNDEARYPILLHCGSANRAGAAWALYRAGAGVPATTAIEEGRAAGMTSREAMVRSVLGTADAGRASFSPSQ